MDRPFPAAVAPPALASRPLAFMLSAARRIAGLAPQQLSPAMLQQLVKALYLRAQCHVAHSAWKRAEADLEAAAQLDAGNKAVQGLLRKIPALKKRQQKDNRVRGLASQSQLLCHSRCAFDLGPCC